MAAGALSAPKPHLLLLLQWPAQRKEYEGVHQYSVGIKDSWSVGEVEPGGGIAKLLLDTESCPHVWVNSRSPALVREQGGVRPGGLGRRQGQEKVALIKNDKLP